MKRPIRPDELRCYDNGGKSFDRYTILPPRYAGKEWRFNARLYPDAWICACASKHPYDPQGFGQHGSAVAGPHIGKRVAFDDLPPDVQRFARYVFCESNDDAHT